MGGYTNSRCRCEPCTHAMLTYHRRRRLVGRIERLATQYAEVVASLEQLDLEATLPSLPSPRRSSRPSRAPVMATPEPAPQAPHRREGVPPMAVPHAVGATGRWRCGHEGQVPFPVTSLGPARTPCPVCDKPGLVAQQGADGWHPVLV